MLLLLYFRNNYEMLVHLSTFEFYDGSDIEELDKNVHPIPDEII